MKRLLCVVGKMDAGGAETFLMKLYRTLNRDKYQMDFCVSSTSKGFYDDEIFSMGGQIFHISAKSKNPLASFKSIYKIVKDNNYERVMRISQHSLSALDLVAAKLGGATERIFRCSNSNTMKGGTEKLLHSIFKFLPNVVPNIKIAPSVPAAEFMFWKKTVQNGKVLFLKNGVPIEQFSFNLDGKKRIRAELGIQDELVLGHIGRFTHQKNHRFILEIFEEILKTVPSAHLILVGQGELEGNIRKQVELSELTGQVHFLGLRKDISEILSAMDVLVFPSLYEGMPNVVIEAQANGLPCVISNTITSEIKICENLHMLPLDNTSFWKDAILNKSKRLNSNINQECLKNSGYDINNVCTIFENTVFGD